MYFFEKRKLFVKLVVVNLLLLSLMLAANYFFSASFWFYVYGVLVLALNFFLLEKMYFSPLYVVTKEVAALLAGKTYSKIVHKKKDEFGLLAYFFNEITKNIENVSTYLKEGSRMASELAMASEIQKSVLPKSLPVVEGLDIVAKSRAAEEVGGDSFDIDKSSNGEYFFYIGDVTGHGAPAGLIMMMVNTLFDVYLPQVSNTKELAVKINNTLKPRVNASMFMTTSFFRWNTESKQLFYTGAGHENIIIYRSKEGISEVFPAGGIALAMAEDVSMILEEKQIQLGLNDIMVLYSDGISEAVNENGELFGLERIKQAVNKYGHLGSSLEVFEMVAKEVQDYVGDTIQKDDMTLMVIRYTDQPVGMDSQENLLSTKWNA